MELEAQTRHRHNHPNSDYIDYYLLAAALERELLALAVAESDLDLAKDRRTIVEDMACKKPWLSPRKADQTEPWKKQNREITKYNFTQISRAIIKTLQREISKTLSTHLEVREREEENRTNTTKRSNPGSDTANANTCFSRKRNPSPEKMKANSPPRSLQSESMSNKTLAEEKSRDEGEPGIDRRSKKKGLREREMEVIGGIEGKK